MTTKLATRMMISCTVKDMTCGHCVSTITRAVREADSSAEIEVDLANQLLRIVSAKPASEFLAAIRAAGYSPVVGSSESVAQRSSCCQS